MMISPEYYYKTELEGHSQQEILKEIRSLKRRISHLKTLLEENDTDAPERQDLPSPDTVIKVSRKYLDKAIQAYEEAGGVYVPSRMEERGNALNEDLHSLQKLVFEIGGFLCGSEERTLSVCGNEIQTEVITMPLLTFPDDPVCPYTKEEFISELRDIRIGEWKRHYEDLNFMDGVQWKLEIFFDNDKRKRTFSGSNAFPWNFRDLADLLGVEFRYDLP